jgi:hypothetical protein
LYQLISPSGINTRTNNFTGNLNDFIAKLIQIRFSKIAQSFRPKPQSFEACTSFCKVLGHHTVGQFLVFGFWRLLWRHPEYWLQHFGPHGCHQYGLCDMGRVQTI